MLRGFKLGKHELKILISKTFQLMPIMFVLKVLILRVFISRVHVLGVFVPVMFSQRLIFILVILI